MRLAPAFAAVLAALVAAPALAGAQKYERLAASVQAAMHESVAADDTIGSDSDRLWDKFLVRGLDSKFTIRSFINPRFREICGFGLVRCAINVWHQISRPYTVVLEVAFVNVAHFERTTLRLVLVPYGNVFLTAVPTEMDVVQVSRAVSGDELLPLQRQCAFAWRL